LKAVYSELHRSHDPQFFLVRGVVKRTTEQPERADRLLTGVKAGGHTLIAPQEFGLKRALVSADRSVSLIQMYEGFRATGVAEFAAPDAPPDMRIADMVMRHAKALVPGLKGEAVSKWMGPRPSHPDSKPVIGRSPRHKNVFFAFGHDHLGLTMAGITGKLIAELATGKPTTVDLAPFRPDRF